MAILAVRYPDGRVQHVKINRRIFSVGKKKGNDFVLDQNNISRQHCRIIFRDGAYSIQDAGSMNGTFLNGRRIMGETPLNHGFMIKVGEVEMTFVDEEVQARAAQPIEHPPPAPMVLDNAPVPESQPTPASPPMPALASAPGPIDAVPQYTPTETARRIPGPVKKKIHLRLIKDLDLKHMDFSKYTEEEIQKKTIEATWLIVKEFRRHIPQSVNLEELVKQVVHEALGLGPLEDLLADDEVDEIMVNGAKQIFVERHGRLELTEYEFMDDNQLLSVIRRIIAPIGRRVDESSPMVDARLSDGSRVNAIIHPLSLDGPTLTIRKFAREPFTINNLVGFNTLTPNMAKFLKLAVENRMNACISGGTGSGKTTTLNVVSSFIPETERIVTIEDSAELKLNQTHVIRLESKPPNIEGTGAIPIRKLVINSLRMRPDRIVVGECRGGEALDMLQAMNTGHDGSLTTVHANNPRDALARLETMVLMAGLDLPSKAIREQISSALQLIVHQSRLPDGKRKITHITEVTGMEGDVITMQDIFLFRQTGFDDQGRVLGEMTPTGAVPKFVHDMRARSIPIDMDIFR
jgi:pilus assembly protein CpaF